MNFSTMFSRDVVLFTLLCLLAPPLYYLYRYRSAVKARLKEIEMSLGTITVVRNKNANTTKNRVMCMELDPQFVKDNPDVPMISLGEYFSQLEPATESGFNHLFLQKELEIMIGKSLLGFMGKKKGAALLPMLGIGGVTGLLAGLSNKLSTFLTKCILSDDTYAEEAFDPMAFEFSLTEFASSANVHQKIIAHDNSGPNPLEYLSRGENTAGDLAYDLGDGDFPTTFHMSDFTKYIKVMEDRILGKEGTYDPDDKSFPPPTPINERLLPGLHFGKGDLKCTHTKREGIEHRLICVLLNKMCHNYYQVSRGQPIDGCFKVVYNGKECVFPEELIQGLVDDGHTVEVCPRVMLSNFGFQPCVKEDDGTFTYIPAALMLNTGIERTSDLKSAYFATPHGGMDVRISGPLIGKGSRGAWLQFYISIDGLTCFHPDQDQDPDHAPWAAKTQLSDIYSHDDAIRAIRMCAAVSVTLNHVAGDLNLPMGGYGILGMCNDSSTLIDFALRSKTNAYPLTSTGRYLNHIVSYLVKLQSEMKEAYVLSDDSVVCQKLKPAIDDILCLIKSTAQLPSDSHNSPATLTSTSSRYDSTYGVPVFQNTKDAKIILREMADAVSEYVE